MQTSERKGLIFSTTLHVAALVWLIVATFFWHSSAANDETVVFDMLPGPKTPFEIPGEKAPGEVNGKKPGSPAKGDQVDIPDLKAPKIPEATVEPVPTPPEPQPESTPPPKPEPKTPSKPAEKAPPPKEVSYEEFLNSQAGKRVKNTPTTVSKPGRKTGAPTRVKIDTGGIRKSLSDMIVAGGEGGGGNGSPDSKGAGMHSGGGGNASAFAAYTRALRARIDAAWDKPDDAPGISATVQFAVSNQGLITSRRIIKSSGSANFDQSILNVFDRLGYVGTPPGGGRNFELTFKLEE